METITGIETITGQEGEIGGPAADPDGTPVASAPLMHSRRRSAWLAIAAALLSPTVSCSAADSPNYGPPGGLTGKKLPLPMGGTIGSGAADAASSATAVDGGSDATDGAGVVCSVSWANDIFPAMAATGAWRCADTSCHGGFQSPKMSADPAVTYASLASYTLALAPQKLRYIMPGATDPAQSGIECNLAGTSCGNQMPLTTTGARLPTAQDVQKVDAWVRCGAPDN